MHVLSDSAVTKRCWCLYITLLSHYQLTIDQASRMSACGVRPYQSMRKHLVQKWRRCDVERRPWRRATLRASANRVFYLHVAKQRRKIVAVVTVTLKQTSCATACTARSAEYCINSLLTGLPPSTVATAGDNNYPPFPSLPFPLSYSIPASRNDATLSERKMCVLAITARLWAFQWTRLCNVCEQIMLSNEYVKMHLDGW